jgi:hypothetical protein
VTYPDVLLYEEPRLRFFSARRAQHSAFRTVPSLYAKFNLSPQQFVATCRS